MAAEKATTKSLEDDRLVNEKEAAQILCLSVHTLRRWRWQGGVGPKFCRLGTATIRYLVSDLTDYAAAGRRK